MKLLSKLFGPTPDSSPTAPATEQPPDAADARIEAIGSLPDGPELRHLAGLMAGTAPGATEQPHPTPAEERAAQNRLAQLIDGGGVDVAELSDAQRAVLVVQGSTSRVRQLAAETVQDPVQLRDLLKQIRDKDKSVYKILKQKLDLLHAKDREAAALVDEINSICTALEKHSHRTFDPLYTAVFEHHHHRWLGLSTQPDGVQVQRAAVAIAGCQAVIAEHARQVALQAEQEAALLAAREAQRLAAEAAEAEAAAKADAAARLHEVAATIHEAETAERTRRLAAEDLWARQIGGLLRKANAALAAGHTQGAAGLRRAIDEKLASAASVPSHLAKGLQQLDDKLNDLKQWKSFAVAPKRVELIRDMEALVGSTEEPKILAERIKTLQEDWKTTSKGIVSEASEDWERFHKASQAAYQPCREFFEAQAQQRRENLLKRQAVLARLQAFEAGLSAETPDWRLLSNVLREAPLEWRAHSPVERDALRTIQAEFDAAMTRLQGRLDAWHAQNVAAKQGLIQRARHQLTLEDGREAIEAIKRLQLQWKDVGAAPRNQEQSLWNEFREQCDAVFKKRQQAHADYAARLDTGKAQATAVCVEIEQAVLESAPPLPEAAAKLSAWRSAFEAAGELPRADARGLQRRFEQAVAKLEAQLDSHRVREAQRSITDVFDAARKIRGYEWAIMQNAPESQRQALREEIEAFLAGMKRGPTGTNQALKDALAKADSVSLEDAAAREKALRILCIRCEILGETATPGEDQALRREYQVQRLVQGLGQGSAGNGDWNAMLLEWIRVVAVTPVIHDELQARFTTCWLRNAAAVRRGGESNRRDRSESWARS